eukprot:COSAG04_NODE_18233_length_448_cov_0.744986_1_plen_85_part_10
MHRGALLHTRREAQHRPTESTRRHTAACTLQAVHRGRVARRRILQQLVSDTEEAHEAAASATQALEREVAAALRIQAWLRGKLAR